MKRASRVPVLNTADVSGEAPTFMATAEEWRDIAGDYRDIDTADQQALAAIVDSYLFWRLPEGTARPRSELLAHLDSIAQAARDLAAILSPDADTVRNMALSEVLERMPSGLSKSGRQRTKRISHAQVSEFIWAIADAAILAKKDASADGQPEFDRHSAWRSLIWELADWADGMALKVSAAKKNESKPGSKRVWPSPFVQFVWRLQEQLGRGPLTPDQLEHQHSPDALTSAIAEVLSERRGRRITNAIGAS